MQKCEHCAATKRGNSQCHAKNVRVVEIHTRKIADAADETETAPTRKKYPSKKVCKEILGKYVRMMYTPNSDAEAARGAIKPCTCSFK
jgi:hypothetical protein